MTRLFPYGLGFALCFILARACPAGSLLGHWELDQVSGVSPITTPDVGPFGYDGTLVNMDGSNQVTGPRDGALQFNGSNERIDVGDVANLDQTFTEFTAMAWLKPDPGTSGFAMGKMGGVSGQRGWQLQVREPDEVAQLAYFNTAGGTQRNVNLSHDFDTSQFTHLAFVFKGGAYEEFYVNGTRALQNTSGTLATLNAANSAPFQIGNRGAVVQYYGGAIDDVRLHDAALVSGQIVQAAHGDQIGHYRFDDVAGGTTPDESAWQQAGTLDNMDGSNVVPGKFGTALEFNGVDETVSVGSADAAPHDSLFTEFTAMAWVKPETDSDGNPANFLFGKMGGGGDRGWQVEVNTAADKTTLLYFDDPSGTSDSVALTGLDLPEDEFTHLAYVFKGDTGSGDGYVDIYVNGQLELHETTGVLEYLNAVNNQPLQIGNRGNGQNNQFFKGAVDDPQFFAAALGRNEIMLAAQIPEPSSLLLALLGGLGLCPLRRRRARRGG
jgi:hypothetical protein